MTTIKPIGLASATFAALADRRAIGDQAIVDWLDLRRITTDRLPRRFTIKELASAWGCNQSTISRRLAKINQAPAAAGLGCVARVRGTRQWELTMPASLPAPGAP